jgi:hypothetical protein
VIHEVRAALRATMLTLMGVPQIHMTAEYHPHHREPFVAASPPPAAPVACLAMQ